MCSFSYYFLIFFFSIYFFFFFIRCEYCDSFRRLRTKISKVIDKFGYSSTETFDADKLLRFFVLNYNKAIEENNREIQREIKAIHEDLKTIKILSHHKMVATCQRIAYNSQKTDKVLLKDNILIELDYKQKIIVNSGICAGKIQLNK